VKVEIGVALKKEREAYLFTLTDVMISSFSMAGEGPNPPETFTLNFKGFRVKTPS